MGKKNKSKRYVVGVDLGATKIFTVVITKKGKIKAKARVKTPAQEGVAAVVGKMVRSVRRAVEKAEISPSQVLAVGVTVPGPINPKKGIVFRAPNLKDWQNVPLGTMLEAELDYPIVLENDVNAGTYGEFALGAARGKRDVVGIFPGTGVGGGIVVGGKLHSGFRYSAAEVGHMIIHANGEICGCGNRGCVEAYASRTAIERDIRAAITQGRPSVITDLIDLENDRITSGVLKKAVKAEDEVVTEVLKKAQYYLGLHVATIVNFFDPEIIVFGGGMIEALGKSFLKPIRQTARAHFTNRLEAKRVKIVPAKLGDYSVALGVAMLARRAVK